MENLLNHHKMSVKRLEWKELMIETRTPIHTFKISKVTSRFKNNYQPILIIMNKTKIIRIYLNKRFLFLQLVRKRIATEVKISST